MSSSIPSLTTPPPTDSKAVLFFWAPWHEASAPGGPLDQALAVLSSSTPLSTTINFGKVEAEAHVDLCETYGVTVVPTVVLINKGGVVVDKVQGENVAAATTAIQRLASMDDSTAVPAAAVPAAISSAAVPTAAAVKGSLSDRLNRLIRSNQVMLFIKGTPAAPKCGFSRQAVELLTGAGIQFGSFDILSDEEVRQGLKRHSNWPTYPQIYVNGDLIGGLDILKELAEEDGGDLRQQLGLAEQPKQESLDDRLKALVNRSKVMLFMKGLPSAPKCGFSRQMCELLNGVAYDSFNIVEDEEVRQGLKTFADWPTYPMLFVNGELVGGLDICKEMAESGELQDLLQA